jgi:5-methylcytosine-specific restriction endonuclease McrA
MDDWVEFSADPVHVKREREKARELRKTDWWRAQLQKGVCHYCGRMVGAESLTMDHVVPVARGGKSVRSNCVPCCKECNNDKKAMTPAERILQSLFPSEF